VPLLTVSSARQESPDQVRGQVGLLVESEVAGVEDVYLGVWHVPSAGLGLLDLERGGVAAPHDLQGWLAFAKPVIPGGIARDVGAVVVEQIGLDVLLAGPAEEGELVGPQVRVVVLGVRAGSDVALPRRVLGEEVLSQRGLVCLAVSPELSPGLPQRAQIVFVGDGILDDERVEPLRVCDREPESQRAAVILHDEGVCGQPESLGEIAEDCGQVVEGVRELRMAGASLCPNPG